jgi:ABC-type sugar transport systems, ATPase components
LTAFENIAFGLRVRKLPDSKVRARVYELAEWLGITYLLGQIAVDAEWRRKQRVALARALGRLSHKFAPG